MHLTGNDHVIRQGKSRDLVSMYTIEWCALQGSIGDVEMVGGMCTMVQNENECSDAEASGALSGANKAMANGVLIKNKV